MVNPAASVALGPCDRVRAELDLMVEDNVIMTVTDPTGPRGCRHKMGRHNAHLFGSPLPQPGTVTRALSNVNLVEQRNNGPVTNVLLQTGRCHWILASLVRSSQLKCAHCEYIVWVVAVPQVALGYCKCPSSISRSHASSVPKSTRSASCFR